MGTHDAGAGAGEPGNGGQVVIPDDVIRLYSAIPAKIQELINQAGLEARDRGESMELRVSELVSLTHLTHDDVHYAKLLSARGEPASSIVKTMLTRAEYLVQNPQSAVASLSPSPISRRVGSTSVGRPMSAREPSGYTSSQFAPPDAATHRTRSPTRRSVTPKHPTRAYANAALEFQAVRQLAKDKSVPGPDAARFGINIRPAASLSPAPETLRRSEIIGKADPNSILGKLLKSSNSAGGIRSRSPRMPSPREPVTMQSYVVPGMADQIKARNRNASCKAAFGSTTQQSTGYLPREVQAQIGAQRRGQTRKAKLTAASKQDAAGLLKSARSARNPSPGPVRRGTAGHERPARGGYQN